jgi:hypothetical protein
VNSGAVYQTDGSVVINVPFNRGLVDDLKDAIPARSRTYDQSSRTWTVWPPYDRDAVRLVRVHFPAGARPEPRSPRTAAPIPINPVERAYLVLHVREDAPDGVIEAAYRYLAKAAHPDRGGSDAAMARLNSAVELLRQRRVAAS